jgi:hypothetical protein
VRSACSEDKYYEYLWTDGTYQVLFAFYEGGGRGVLEIGWDWEG